MAHAPVISADSFVTCACGLRCGSKYFHALHAEEQLDALDHPTAWPEVHLTTVPRALWPQRGVIARNTHDLPATEYTTARLADGAELEPLRRALQLVPQLGRAVDESTAAALGCAMVALGPKALAALGAPHPDNLTAFLPKLAGDSGAELFPAGNSDLLLFVKSPNAETAAAGTAAFLAAAGPALHDVQTTGAHHQLLTCLWTRGMSPSPSVSQRCCGPTATSHPVSRSWDPEYGSRPHRRDRRHEESRHQPPHSG
jgi:hypothetical protein